MKKLNHYFRDFVRSESGSQTIEAVIWVPIFVFFLAFMVNVAMVFFNESQMLRVVQDANRAFSLGWFTTDIETEQHITQELAYLSPNVTVDTVVDGGIIKTQLSIPAFDMMPLKGLGKQFFSTTQITVQAEHVVEF
ncbi:TadE/TadG family type IV pilus assembly protein [Marimonas arenosa]|uniref:Pilus assembly protein n=1 Tax=Marimonas arenosa TaxID=1795305 RepID=A0AAE4B3R0_9RHOB|nr:TadE family protein [Marimonas arenosa]MDQ2089450.1 pilus assembly protein [Marimonas arenosa]